MADTTTTEKTKISDTINKIIGGDKPLITTSNKVELGTESVTKTALAVGGVFFFFWLLIALTKREINK